ncbi:MAG: rod shape-determining protein RodA [Acidiferrobacterales bacterium]
MATSLTTLQRWNLDKPLGTALLMLAIISLGVIFSASGKDVSITVAQLVRLGIGFSVLFLVAQIHPDTLARWTPYIYIVGLVLLVIVLITGVIGKGAQRWLNLGLFSIQPSEIMKLAVPMMVAWYFSQQHLPATSKQVVIGAGIILLPSALVAVQPDLGTALMIISSGAFVLFLAGMGWTLIAGILVLIAASAPLIWSYLLHDYQRNRVLTLFDPTADPLGTGYHTIQSMIAVGSGGIFGKGWLESSQARLDFLPESSTDFIFAVFAEEFGLFGIVILFSIFVFTAGRGIIIATYAQETYTRLLAGSLALTFFLYFFVNIGMVTGILPVVGVPLPIISYGGSSVVTLMAGFGMLMSIHANRKIAQP